MVRKMKTRLEDLNQAFPSKADPSEKAKFEQIKSLVEQGQFVPALEEIKRVEDQKEMDELSTLWGDFCYLSAVALHGLGNYREAKAKAEKADDFFKNT